MPPKYIDAVKDSKDYEQLNDIQNYLLKIKYDNTDNIIDGWDGIYVPGVNSNYMLVNQIEKDRLGNIWITNPFCEK